jgi:hypothetical protein
MMPVEAVLVSWNIPGHIQLSVLSSIRIAQSHGSDTTGRQTISSLSIKVAIPSTCTA